MSVTSSTAVPCGSCRACCRGGHVVVLVPPDDAYSYDFIWAPPDPATAATLAESPRGREALFPLEMLAPHIPPDVLAQYRAGGVTELVAQLTHRENGDCVYLGENGCTIHDRAPQVCKAFDCRKLFMKHTRAERRAMIKNGDFSKEVFAAGRERLGPLPARGGG